MIWSKLKRSTEALLATSVKEHLQLHLTRYGPGESYIMNRAWITWDGEEVNTFSTIQKMLAHNTLVAHMREDSEPQKPSASFEQAEEMLEQRGVYSRDDFYSALEEYISLSIEAALYSPNTLIRAWAMFDRRLGKRRLSAMRVEQADHLLVQQWYRLRCQAEGISIPLLSQK